MNTNDTKDDIYIQEFIDEKTNIRYKLIGDQKFIHAMDLAKNVSTIYRKEIHRDGKIYTSLVRWDRVNEYSGREYGNTDPWLTIDQVIKILQTSRSVIDPHIYELVGLHPHSVILSKEVDSLLRLKDVFGGIYGIAFQYTIGTYKVDACLLNVDIVIECDEFDHKEYGRNQAYEDRRTKFLHEQGYTIYRYNPDDKNFDIFKVIGDINRIIYQKHRFIVNNLMDENFMLRHQTPKE